jgi:hypothetical protein
MKYINFLTFVFLTLSQALFSQNYCLTYAVVPLTDPNLIIIKVNLSGSTGFNLSDANLVFSFNTAALESPVGVSNTLTAAYSPTTTTNPAANLVSINIDCNGTAGTAPGININTTPTEIAQVQFTVKNASLSKDIATSATYCVVYKDAAPPALLNLGSSCPTLSLEWLDFQARVTLEKQVDLDWTTAAERNVQHFVVERSRDGKTFEKIGNSIAPNNTIAKRFYHITDEKPLLGVSFYRVRELSMSGESSFSPIRAIDLSGEKIVFSVHPNPKDKETPLSIQTNWAETYTFFLYDATGKRIYSHKCKGAMQLNDLNLVGGFYLYECTTAQDKVMGKLIVPN